MKNTIYYNKRKKNGSYLRPAVRTSSDPLGHRASAASAGLIRYTTDD